MKLEALVWKTTHRDFKGVSDGTHYPKGARTILFQGGLCALSDLSDDDLLSKLRTADRLAFLAS